MLDAAPDATDTTTPCPSEIPLGPFQEVGGATFRIEMRLDSGTSCHVPIPLKAFVYAGETGVYFKTLWFDGGMASDVYVLPGQSVWFQSSTYCFQTPLMPARCDVVAPYDP